MTQKALFLVMIVAAMLIVGGEVSAQEDGAVHAVFFYSPTCPHCHKVITEDLPPMQEEFGEDLQVLFINVAVPEGRQMLLDVCDPFGIPEQVCGSVPTMILADEVMIGSVDIPERMPQLVRDGLAEGGIALPDIPGLQEIVDEAAAEESGVVHAVFFYSPTCPHCHKVITEDLPPMEEEFGEDLQVLFINVDEESGAQMLLDACEPFSIDDEFCGSVPTVIMADQVLIGSVDIPERMPQLVRDGLAEGGIALPDIPGIVALYESATQRSSDVETEGGQVGAGGAGVCSGLAQACIASVSWQDRYTDDLFGNGLATLVLMTLIGSVAVLTVGGLRGSLAWLADSPGWIITTVIALAAALVAGTLLMQVDDISIFSGIALAITVALLIAAGIIWDSGEDGAPEWIFPLVALAGLAVAGYMTYIEVTGNEAVCGTVGDCNLVQQSKYAELFGVIPVGALGLVAYVLIFGAWWMSRREDSRMAHVVLLGLLLGGVIFSAYLTFLEPFVIGASCAWCLTSAMVLLLLLWLEAPEG
jgi:uncharacterized membrane protein/thiol-disulfide isomerase/thioredoxin